MSNPIIGRVVGGDALGVESLNPEGLGRTVAFVPAFVQDDFVTPMGINSGPTFTDCFYTATERGLFISLLIGGLDISTAAQALIGVVIPDYDLAGRLFNSEIDQIGLLGIASVFEPATALLGAGLPAIGIGRAFAPVMGALQAGALFSTDLPTATALTISFQIQAVTL